MRVNGTLINYYFHCKRQCYLHGNRLNLEVNSRISYRNKKIRRRSGSRKMATFILPKDFKKQRHRKKR